MLTDETTRRLAGDVNALIREGDLARAGKTIRLNGLTDLELQSGFLSAAGCDAETMRYLIDEIGVDPFMEQDGETTVFLLTWPNFANGPYQCAESERVAPVEVLLELGVDPCRAPDWEVDNVPAVKAREWGRTAEMEALLREYANECVE